MAAPILIAERYPGVVMMAAPFAIRQASRLRKPIPSVREQRFVAGYVWKQPVKSLVFHGYTPQYRFFVGHSCTHSCDPPEVAVETFNPIGRTRVGKWCVPHRPTLHPTRFNHLFINNLTPKTCRVQANLRKTFLREREEAYKSAES